MTNSPSWAFDVPEKFLLARAEREEIDPEDACAMDMLMLTVVGERLSKLSAGAWEHPVFGRESHRHGRDRAAQIKKHEDLVQQVVRLSRLARVGKKVTHESLAGTTDHQLRLLVDQLKAIRQGQLDAEFERMSPEQQVMEVERLKGRQLRQQQHAATRPSRRDAAANR